MEKLFPAAILVALAMPAWAGSDATRLARGKYLVEGVLACANCHAVRDDKGQVLPERGMAGGREFDLGILKAYARNITPDPETGIGRWSDVQLARSIREGLRPDGSVVGPPMPVHFYRSLSDADMAAVVRYLRAQPAVRAVVPKSVYSFPLPPNYGPPLRWVKAPPAKDQVAYGGYLITIGHCMECHTPRDANGRLVQARLGAGGQVFKGPWGESTSRNLTSHAQGLRDWTDAQIATAIRHGTDRSGAHYKPPMAFDWYRNISDADLSAMIRYLRTLPPQAGDATVATL
jgi:mono/diheme cytochrome c family protein